MDNLLGQISSKLASSSKSINLTINTKQVSNISTARSAWPTLCADWQLWLCMQGPSFSIPSARGKTTPSPRQELPTTPADEEDHQVTKALSCTTG
jgi:hypothetical protein